MPRKKKEVTQETPEEILETPEESEETLEESEESEEDRPRVQLGEDIQLGVEEFDDDKDSVSTEDELASKAVDVVALNL
jgi:hypothetical protein